MVQVREASGKCLAFVSGKAVGQPCAEKAEQNFMLTEAGLAHNNEDGSHWLSISKAGVSFEPWMAIALSDEGKFTGTTLMSAEKDWCITLAGARKKRVVTRKCGKSKSIFDLVPAPNAAQNWFGCHTSAVHFTRGEHCLTAISPRKVELQPCDGSDGQVFTVESSEMGASVSIEIKGNRVCLQESGVLGECNFMPGLDVVHDLKSGSAQIRVGGMMAGNGPPTCLSEALSFVSCKKNSDVVNWGITAALEHPRCPFSADAGLSSIVPNLLQNQETNYPSGYQPYTSYVYFQNTAFDNFAELVDRKNKLGGHAWLWSTNYGGQCNVDKDTGANWVDVVVMALKSDDQSLSGSATGSISLQANGDRKKTFEVDDMIQIAHPADKSLSIGWASHFTLGLAIGIDCDYDVCFESMDDWQNVKVEVSMGNALGSGGLDWSPCYPASAATTTTTASPDDLVPEIFPVFQEDPFILVGAPAP